MSKYSDEQESQKAPPEPIKMGIEGKEVSEIKMYQKQGYESSVPKTNAPYLDQ